VAGAFERGDEPSGPRATELVNRFTFIRLCCSSKNVFIRKLDNWFLCFTICPNVNLINAIHQTHLSVQNSELRT
jgi:hypothetical protein